MVGIFAGRCREGSKTGDLSKTENYDLVLSKLKELEPVARKGYELSDSQMRQVRQNMVLRLGILTVSILAIVLVIIGSVKTYFVASYNVSVWRDSIFKIMEQRIAYRSRRRIYRATYFCVATLFLALGKMILDIVKADVFTYVPVEVLDYYESRGNVLKKLGGDYRYFAKVKYGNGTVDVGLSKKMWEQRETVRPLLVLRKNVPYCLIY